jgi:hypothetical protein
MGGGVDPHGTAADHAPAGPGQPGPDGAGGGPAQRRGAAPADHRHRHRRHGRRGPETNSQAHGGSGGWPPAASPRRPGAAAVPRASSCAVTAAGSGLWARSRLGRVPALGQPVATPPASGPGWPPATASPPHPRPGVHHDGGRSAARHRGRELRLFPGLAVACSYQLWPRGRRLLGDGVRLRALLTWWSRPSSRRGRDVRATRRARWKPSGAQAERSTAVMRMGGRRGDLAVSGHLGRGQVAVSRRPCGRPLCGCLAAGHGSDLGGSVRRGGAGSASSA